MPRRLLRDGAIVVDEWRTRGDGAVADGEALLLTSSEFRAEPERRLSRGGGPLAHRLSRGARSLAHPFCAPAQVVDHVPKGTPPLCRHCGIATM